MEEVKRMRLTSECVAPVIFPLAPYHNVTGPASRSCPSSGPFSALKTGPLSTILLRRVYVYIY
jgi:hypothetical protein